MTNVAKKHQTENFVRETRWRALGREADRYCCGDLGPSFVELVYQLYKKACSGFLGLNMGVG